MSETWLLRTTSGPGKSSEKGRVVSRSLEPSVPCERNRVLSVDVFMGLLQLDSGIADDLAPKAMVGAQPLGGGFGGAAAGLRGEVEEALADLEIVDGRLQVPVEEAAAAGRRPLRSKPREPCAHPPAGQPRLRRSRHVGQATEPLLRGCGEWPDLARFQIGQR